MGSLISNWLCSTLGRCVYRSKRRKARTIKIETLLKAVLVGVGTGGPGAKVFGVYVAVCRNGCRACDGFIWALSPEIRSICFVIHAFLACCFVVYIRSYSCEARCESVWASERESLSLLAIHCTTERITIQTPTTQVRSAYRRMACCCTLDSPEGVEVSGLRAVSGGLREQRPSRTWVHLRGARGVPRAAGTRGGGRGSAWSGGRLQGAPLRRFVGRNAIVSPVGARTGGARRVGAGGFALSSLSLTASFSLMVAVGWEDGGDRGEKKLYGRWRSNMSERL